MISDFGSGFSAAWSGLAALRVKGLRRFVIVPLSVNIAVFAMMITFGMRQFARLLDYLLAYLPGWLDWLEWLLWPLFALATLLVSVYAFTLVANFLAAPFNGQLSERYETMLTGVRQGEPVRPLAGELVRAPLHELAKLAYMIKWLVPLALLFLVPGINFLAPALWLVFGGWLLALEYMDYPMDNHAIDIGEQRSRLAGRRWLALGFGAGMMLMTSIPVLNFFAVPAGVLGATGLWCREFRTPGASPG